MNLFFKCGVAVLLLEFGVVVHGFEVGDDRELVLKFGWLVLEFEWLVLEFRGLLNMLLKCHLLVDITSTNRLYFLYIIIYEFRLLCWK